MNELGIEITSICSFNCYFCGIEDREKHTLTTEVFKRVVDEALELGYDSFVLTPKNGDVFCDSDIYEKLKYLKDKGVPYYFFTNLHLTDPIKLSKVMSPLGKIYLSEYGKSDEEFESLTRRPKSFRHKVLKNMRLLNGRILYGERNDEYISEAKSFQKSENIIENKVCTEAYNHSISSNGDVLLCTCGRYNPHLKVGNIYTQSLKNVFTSDIYRDMIYHMIEVGMDNDLCRRCPNHTNSKSPKQMIKNLLL